ncbi:MAG: SsrA-binding protein SmpB [Cytophagales bacterium]|nr:SsrA-binding protein SmpB [Cytophagales bacterium]
MADPVFSKSIEIKNKKVLFEYQLLDTYVAGIILEGTEIKSIRQGKVNFMDAYCYFAGSELRVKSLNISEYANASFYKHSPDRERGLLLKKKELKKLLAKSEEKGLSIVPVKLFINDRGFAKLEIALAKGKKLHDKRDDIKERDIKRELSRSFKI